LFNLTFVSALFIFAICLTLVFLWLLSKRTDAAPKSANPTLQKVLIFVILCFEVISIVFMFNYPFKETLYYSGLMLTIPCMLLLLIKSLNGKFVVILLSLVLVFHFILLYEPLTSIFINEGGTNLANLVKTSHWDTSNSINSIYGPFPMYLGLDVMFSTITNISYISPLTGSILSVCLIFAFDLVLYCLTYQITKNPAVGVFAVLLFCLTPPANLTLHMPKWTGILLMLISISALLKVLETKQSKYCLVIILSYAAAIFYHPSAFIGTILLTSIILTSYLAGYIGHKKTWVFFSKNGFLLTTLLLFIVISATRAMYTEGYLNTSLSPLQHFIFTMFGETPTLEFIPVYETSVNWYNSYAWVIVPAMSTAFITYALLKRKCSEKPLLLFLYISGIFFILTGWLFGVTHAVYGSFRGATYPAFALLAPVAAFLAWKVLSSSKTKSYLLIALIVVSTGVALTDPMISRVTYAKTGAQDIATNEYDYAEALLLIDILPQNKSLLAPSELQSSFGYLTVLNGKPSFFYIGTGGAERLRQTINSVAENKSLVSEVVYIWPPRWGSELVQNISDVTNQYYDSGRFVIFEEAT
jgi:hypothetical protein